MKNQDHGLKDCHNSTADYPPSSNIPAFISWAFSESAGVIESFCIKQKDDRVLYCAESEEEDGREVDC